MLMHRPVMDAQRRSFIVDILMASKALAIEPRSPRSLEAGLYRTCLCEITKRSKGEIWSRKVAPEGLPWVLLYEVKGRAASPVTWFIRRLLVILGPPPPPPSPPPKSLRRTLRADSKHCNLQYFCSFRIKKPHFATWWNLRKYQCFC